MLVLGRGAWPCKWCIRRVWNRCRRFRCETQLTLGQNLQEDSKDSFRKRLVFDNDHREGRLYLVEVTYFPSDDLFQLIHAVSGDLRYDVVDPIDHVSLLDLRNRL